MRALLLCSLGAVLLWFAWHSFSGSTANAADDVVSPGVMLPPEKPTDAPSVPSAVPPPDSQSGGQPAVRVAAAQRPESAKVAVSPPAAADVEPRPVPISVLPDKAEIDLARTLVSNPEGFVEIVEKRSDLPSARRNFALALGKALTGKHDEARGLSNGIAEETLVRASEKAFLDRLLGGRVTIAQAASATTESALVWAALLVSESREGERLANEGKSADAARTFSSVLLDYVRAPWPADRAVLQRWSDSLEKNQRRHRWNRTGEWPSVEVKVVAGDSLIGLRKRVLLQHPELQFCTGQIVRANEKRSDMLREGETLRVPIDRVRMLVDLDAHWAFYLVANEVAAAYEIGVGKDGATRVGRYVVGNDKRKDPMWFKPGGPPVPFGSPENPLGTRWIAWLTEDGNETSLGFHGTNDPRSIGKDESQGCIRMLDDDIEELFEILPVGAVIDVQA